MNLEGLKIAPLGETLPKKHLQNFTLKDANLNKLPKYRLTIYEAFLKGYRKSLNTNTNAKKSLKGLEEGLY